MKPWLTGLAAARASSWKQPTYWDAFERAKERMSAWGHPVDERAAASYHLCPEISLPAGVQERNHLINYSIWLLVVGGSLIFPTSFESAFDILGIYMVGKGNWKKTRSWKVRS